MADTPDPRQEIFLTHYLDPKSETFSNATQSAVKAGYSQEYADNLLSLMPKWLSESIGDSRLVKAAEKALLEAVEYTTVDEEGKVDAGAGRLKLDAAKLILKGMRKEKYSERHEHTGDGGKDLGISLFGTVIKDGVPTDNSTEES